MSSSVSFSTEMSQSAAASVGTQSATNKGYLLFHSSTQMSNIKLDRTNFLIWESVVLSLIEGNRQESHINGTGTIPIKYIPGDAGVTSNPAYEGWFSNDRMLVGWLRNTMSQDVGAQLLHCRTARDLWVGARYLTSASTEARIMVHKSDMHSTRKNSLKLEEYLAKMKHISNQLALAGSPISTDELIMHTLNGLDADYNAIVVKLLD